MLQFVVTLPGRFGEWCQTVTAKMMASRAPVEAISADTLAQLSVELLRCGSLHAVVCCRQPDGRIRSALIDSGRRFIAACDDPKVACAELVTNHGHDLPTAVQMVSTSCAAMLGFVCALVIAGAMRVTRVNPSATK